MPQGSLFPESELTRVVVTLRYNELKACHTVVVEGHNRWGLVLARQSAELVGHDEGELLEPLLRDVVRGYLYRGAHEAVSDPMQCLRGARSMLRRNARLG
jgi:hypothetical protein